MNQSPKWRVWFADETIRGADGATQTRAWVSDFERSHTIPVIELSAVKELVDALKYYANEETWDREGVAAHVVKNPKEPMGEYLDYWVDYGSVAKEALAKVPAEVLGE